MSRQLPDFETHPATFVDCQTHGVYRGIALHVVDGDTFDVLIDLGFLNYTMITVRLYGVNTAELNAKETVERDLAKEAKAFVASRVIDQPIIIKTYKDKKSFGRYVAKTWVARLNTDPDDLDEDACDFHKGRWKNLSSLLIHQELGVRVG